VQKSEVAIRQLVADAEAFQNTTDRFTELLTEHVVVVNIAGIRVMGKDALTSAMSRALETSLANVLTKTEITDIQFVRPDVAIVSCIKQITDQNLEATETFPSRGNLTFVIVNEKDGWRIALAQTTPVLA
jgi:uncharacterized protein (TIGR02246 family)